MSSPAVFATPDSHILEAMTLLVEKGISGLPVCSACGRPASLLWRQFTHFSHTDAALCGIGEEGHVLGIVSGYDLLAVDATPGKLDASLEATHFFPPVNLCARRTWESLCTILCTKFTS